MSLSQLLLAVWLILLGGDWATLWSISSRFLGFLAVLIGILFLVEGYHPVTVWRQANRP